MIRWNGSNYKSKHNCFDQWHIEPKRDQNLVEYHRYNRQNEKACQMTLLTILQKCPKTLPTIPIEGKRKQRAIILGKTK